MNLCDKGTFRAVTLCSSRRRNNESAQLLVVRENEIELREVTVKATARYAEKAIRATIMCKSNACLHAAASRVSSHKIWVKRPRHWRKATCFPLTTGTIVWQSLLTRCRHSSPPMRPSFPGSVVTLAPTIRCASRDTRKARLVSGLSRTSIHQSFIEATRTCLLLVL